VTIDIRVVVLPEPDARTFADDLDPGDVVFDADCTPILKFGYRQYGITGWMLFTEDGETYFVPGDLADVDWALDEARNHLARKAEQ
jgi:hypothetical protein